MATSDPADGTEVPLRAVFDATHDGMLVACDGGHYLDANRAAAVLFGVSRDALVGGAMATFGVDLDFEKALAAARAGKDEVNEVVICRPDGHCAHAEIRVTADVRPGRHLLVLRDLTAQKEAERALLESERRYRLLVESSSDVVYITDQGRFRYVSPSMKTLFGYEPSELVGVETATLVHPDDLGIVRAAIVATQMTKGPAAPVMFRARHRDGSYRVIEAVGHDMLDEPSIGGLVVAARDVTDRERGIEELRRSEAVLRLSQSRLEKAQAVGHLGSWTLEYTPAGRRFEATDETIRIYGIAPASFHGDPLQLHELLHADDREWTREVTHHARETGESFAYDARILRVDGIGWIHVEGVVETSDDRTVCRILGTTLDITNRKRTETELLASEARYRRIIDTTSEGVCLNGADRAILFANRRLSDMLGYAPGEIEGNAVTDLIAGGMTPEIEAKSQDLRRGTAIRIELGLLKKDGTSLRAALTMTPQFDDAGRFDGSLALVTDITERHRAERAEQTLRETEEQLRQAQKLEGLGQLAGGVAHDFNNLLSVILGYTSIILQELTSSDPMRRDVEQIHEAGVRASDLTRQLLAFSRKAVLQPRVIEVNGVLRQAERIMQRLLGEHIELEIVEHAGSTAVHADPGQLEQVVLNLAVNARDAMPEGGRLRIGVERTELLAEDAARLGIAPGSHVVLTVADHGVGMDAAVIERIFEPFFTTKEKGKGTGLGLSTVFGIVKQSAGHVTVTSSPGAGATFRVLLPASDASVERADGSRSGAPTTRAATGETILLAEDEAQVRTLACTILRRAGYHVLEAANGEEALRVADGFAGTIDLLLTDVVMPRLGGHPLASQLRERRPTLKVLFMSGYTDDTVLRHGVELGELEFLPKPFTPNGLTARVRTLLELVTTS